MTSSVVDSTTRNRSNSGEDSELPEHDRKRPRLSDGKSDAEHHIPGFQPNTQHNTSSAGSSPTPKPSLPPRSSEIKMSTPSPTSKVTINTRPLSSQSMNTVIPPSNGGPAESLPPQESIAGSSQPNGTSVSAPISISSSPALSPEIEVAEVEDYDQDPSETRWTRRLGGGAPSMSPIRPFHVYNTFPLAAQVKLGEGRLAVDALCKILADGTTDITTHLTQVKDWFVDFAERCNELTSDIVEEDTAFWARAANLVFSLLRREHKTGPALPTDDLVDFFNAYGEITRLVLRYERRKLQNLIDNPLTSPTDVILISWYWLTPAAWIIGNRANIFDSLRVYHDVDPLTIRRLFINHVMSPSKLDLMSCIIDLITTIGLALPKQPKLSKELTPVFSSLETLVRFSTASTINGTSSPSELLPQAEVIRVGTERILLQLDEMLQVAIKKQQTWLTIENAMDIVDNLNKCMKVAAEAVPRIAEKIIAYANMQLQEDDMLHVDVTMPHAWKFATLNKFIKHGRMELRVAGVEKMSTDLVDVYYKYIQNSNSGPEEPAVKFLVRFLRANDMTRYLVSVDSHPNLAERASNLVGFLSVAREYTNNDTDSIWEVVEHGQDPRMIAAALQLLNGCFVTYTLSDYHHICEKLLGLAFDRIDDRILQFTLQVISNIRQKTNSMTMLFDSRYDPVTRRLCLRFLREANVPGRCATEHATVSRKEILQMHTYFIQPSRGYAEQLAISEEEQAELTAQLRGDIDSHGEYACGAVLVLNDILGIPGLGIDTLVCIIDQCACPSVLVENIAALSEETRTRPESAVEPLQIQFESRLTCLFNLLKIVPDRLDQDMLQMIWTSVLTARHLPETIRMHAWAGLTMLMRQPKSPNLAIDMLLDQFWTKLRPADINKPILDFAKQSVIYETALNRQLEAPSGGVFSIPGIERVWTIMLACPTGTVEVEATDFIISQYLRSPAISRKARSEIHETHLALIDRCVTQVIGSAERLRSFADAGTRSDSDEGMVIIASDDEIGSEELKFDRSLLFLRCFTNALKKDPSASPVSTRHSEELPEFENARGESKELSIAVQANRYMTNAIRKVRVGADNTGVELADYITNATGFSKFTAVHSGKKLNLQEDTSSLAELGVFQGMPLMICKMSSTEERLPRGYRAGSPVDNKIMLHFDDLYALLDAESRLAKEVYDFLRTTSVRDKISEPIRTMSTSAAELLPSQKPYKLLFCTEALKACVELEYFSKNPDTVFISYAIAALNAAVTRVGGIGFADPLYMSITYEILETLSMACRIKVSAETSRAYFTSPQVFVDHLTQFLACAQQSREVGMTHKEPEALVKVALEVLFEACLHVDQIWQVLDNHESFQKIFRRCALDDDRENVRRSILDVVLALNGSAGAKITFKMSNPHAARSRFDASQVEACLIHIWGLLLPVLVSATQQSRNCQELCDASLVIFKVIGKAIASENLQKLLTDWSAALLDHDYQEIVGQVLQDRFISGMTKLLCECARQLRIRGALASQAQLMQDLIVLFLFPPLSESKLVSALSRPPVLDSTTRQCLYDLLLVLCQTSEENDALRAETSNDLVEKDYFSPMFTNDRQALRSEVGYAGIRNLSNTCYLNSLLSQLFMHVPFRNLLLNTSIIDEQKQKLFVELGKVFAYMQSSQEKAVDPEGAVNSIVTYEGGEIDVTVQMDVDEFFNLLFDRLEGQIVDEKVKTYFKSLYGGETIQQIKSKECEHVSERPESFAVLPVEIKGKTRLEESLKAYVDGEVLQGDNKYSCTSCGRHVDAVKRNCLKEVPDNLIFNLKRFDFDIMTGTRCKLNDLFQFPEELDVTPYTLEHLSHPDEPMTSDVFELTGVIVHSGTADSGHYFSYIRQRPSAKDKSHSWVQFNDSDVTPFDPMMLQDNCFGGIDANCYNLVKFYSAYMLFYQRKSSIQQIEHHFLHTDPVNPLRLSASTQLEHHIAQQNELFLRAYCVQDENHARFVRDLLARLWDSSAQQCSDDHAIEDRALQTTLDYVQQVSSRWKGQPEMEETLKLVFNFVSRCEDCARTACRWFVKADVATNSIVRSPYGATRKAFCALLKICLEKLHNEAEADDGAIASYKEVLDSGINSLASAWESTFRHPRSWTEYFTLLHEILLLGDLESEVVGNYKFFEYCLHVIRLHTMEPSEVRSERRNKGEYCWYVNAREKNRVINNTFLINFFAALLVRYDLRNLDAIESVLMGMDHMPYTFHWLRRIIMGRHAPAAADCIVQHLAQDHDLAGPVAQVLTTGVEHKNMAVAVAHLDPIVTFCRYGVHEAQVVDLVGVALDSVQTIDLAYGSEYLTFVEKLLAVQNDVAEVEKSFLAEKVLSSLPDWVPALVVAPNEAQHDVRGGTLAIIQQLLLQPMEEARDDDPPKYRQLQQIAAQLATKSSHYARSSFVGRAKENASMQPGQINELVMLIEKIFELLEPGSVMTEQRQAEISGVIHLLRLKNEHAVEALSPENWQESSDLDVSDEGFDDITSP